MLVLGFVYVEFLGFDLILGKVVWNLSLYLVLIFVGGESSFIIGG